MSHYADDQLPAVGDGSCCMGAAVYGPERCTCWERVYEHPVQPPRLDEPTTVRPTPCGDCAFRVDSPERTGDPHARADESDLDAVVDRGRFYCHEAMQLPVALVHEVTGDRLEDHPAMRLAYQAEQHDGRAFVHTGAPARLCAGWAARRRARGF